MGSVCDAAAEEVVYPLPVEVKPLFLRLSAFLLSNASQQDVSQHSAQNFPVSKIGHKMAQNGKREKHTTAKMKFTEVVESSRWL